MVRGSEMREEIKSYYDYFDEKNQEYIGCFKKKEVKPVKPWKCVSLFALIAMVGTFILCVPIYFFILVDVGLIVESESVLSWLKGLLGLFPLLLTTYIIHTGVCKFFIDRGLTQGRVGRVIHKIWKYLNYAIAGLVGISIVIWLISRIAGIVTNILSILF